jgi:hypothetical protein
MLPPWADLAAMLFSVKDVIFNVGELFINLKKNGIHMKTSIIKISKTKLVWNMVG